MSPSFDERRLSFGEAADAYARFRPGYPRAAVDWVHAAASGPVTRVADVGAGTGALTALLDDSGLDVTAVEPDASMIGQLARRVPAATVCHAHAEAIPLADSQVDSVLVAQAWHWMDHEAAASEFARVTRPGGALGILWNVRDLSADWMRELGDLIGGEDSMRAAVRVRASDDPDAITLTPPWCLPVRGEFRHEVMMTADSLVGLVGTYSYVRLRPDAGAVLSEVHRIATEHPEIAGRAEFPMPYITVVYRSVRR